MSNIYALYIYEDIFHGQRGFCRYIVSSFVDKKEAKDFAFEQSCDLIRNTSIIMNKYERMAQETGLDVDIFVKNDATYEIYEVQDKHLSQEQLQREFSQDYEKFIDKYCS